MYYFRIPNLFQVLKYFILLCVPMLTPVFVFSQGPSLFLDAPVKWVNAGNINVTGSNLSLEAMVHIVGNSTGNIISKHTGQNNTNYLLRLQSFEITTSNGYASLLNPMVLQSGETYHVAATYNGSFMRYYVNGCLTAEMPWSGTLITNTFATAIGQQSNCQCEQFTGYLDEVRIWNVARTEAQIRGNMYNIANPNFQFNLLAYFKFQNNFNNLAALSPGATQVGGPALNPLPYPYPSALTISHTGSNVICHDSNTGAIDLQASGGLQPYQFSLDGINFQETPLFENLTAGNYTIYVKSNDNCVATATRNIQNKTPINFNLQTINVSCPDDLDGSASVAPSGGNGSNFALDWSNGQMGNSISGLAPGAYSIVVRDSCRVAGNELVVNGHFEEGAIGFTSEYNNCTSCFAGVGGELFEDQFVVGLNANQHHVAFNGAGQGGGGNFMMVNGSSEANTNVWCQTIDVQSNTYYEFSTWVTSIFAQSPALLQFQANGVLLGPIFTAPSTLNTWTQFFSVWFSGTNTSVSICIINQNTSMAGNDFGIDNISFKACLSCEVEQGFTIENPEPLTATISIQSALCGTNSGSIQIDAKGGTPAYTFSIDGVTFAPNSLIENLGPGIYTVTVKDASDCEFSQDISITDNDDISIDAGIDQSLCFGQTITLTAQGPTGFTWSDGVIDGTPFTPNETQYFIVEINFGPTCFAIDSVLVTVHPLPEVNAGDNMNLCSLEEITINATGALNYTWSNGLENGETFTLEPGLYTLTVIGTDANGCENSDAIDVEVFPLPDVSISANPTTGFVPLTVTFENNSQDDSNYFWDFGDGQIQNISAPNTTFTFNAAGSYWVTVSTEENGCMGGDSILILVESSSLDFEVPNVFSPNGDEENPNFLLINLNGKEQVSDFEILILNRWGHIIQTFDTPEFFWDGKDKYGNLVSEGVYFYKILYQLQDATEGARHGFVHVIR